MEFFVGDTAIASSSAMAKELSLPICTCVSNLMARIRRLRSEEFAVDSADFTLLTPNDKHAWTKIFAEFFLINAHCVVEKCAAHSDDMLWYVRVPNNILMSAAGFYSGPSKSPLDVYRRSSKKQPVPGDESVNWEETVYLNFILQQVDFCVTVAVCTKTGPHNLQILRKNCEGVYPSPSRRKMDSKGESEEIAYPNIYFAIDNFDQAFSDVIIRDGECVCVELVAKDRYRAVESAVFLGSIRYEVIKQVYDTRASGSWGGWAQRLMASRGRVRRQEFVRMRGPHGKGYAEMAVARIEGLNDGYETPIPEEYDASFDPSQPSRRLSETNLNRRFPKYGINPVKKSQSEADTSAQYPEVEANSIDEELEEGTSSRLWSVRGFGQTWHWLRERRRAASTPLNAFLTYVTLPWNSILDDLLHNPKKPLLSFGFDSCSSGTATENGNT